MLKQSFKLSIYFLTFTFLFSNQLSIQNVDLSNGTLEVQMQNDGPVGGFQFDLTNVVVTGAQGGSAASNGFLISTSSTTVLGFSLTGGTIPAGEGTLLEVSFDGSPEEICLSSVVLSDPTGTQIDSDVGDCFNSGDANDEAEGFEVGESTIMARPTLTFANTGGTFSTILALVNQVTPKNDLQKARITRKRTLAQFLDKQNFPNQTNPFGTPDSTKKLDDQIFDINKKVIENNQICSFELVKSIDFETLFLPRRQITKDRFPACGTFVYI